MSEKEINNTIEEKEEDSLKKDKRKFAAIDDSTKITQSTDKLSKIHENYNDNDIIPENDNIDDSNKITHSTDKLSKIDENYSDIIPENDNIVYFLILSHGSVDFKDNVPVYIDIPKNIDYFNKITYAPFGFTNYGTNDTLMLKSITEKIKTLYEQSNTPIVENKLIDVLQQVDCVLKMQKEYIEKSKTYPNRDEHIKGICGRKMILEREDILYQSVLYTKSIENNKPIIQKSFSISEDDSEEMNIYVIFAKGENGFLYEGDEVLNSQLFRDYLSTIFYDDDNEVLENQNIISTEGLLEFAEFCNYKNVVFIDYSCDVCINYSGEKVPRNEVMNIRNEKITTNLVGRGGIHKKLKKSKKRRVTRKLRKSKKVKKNRKPKTRKYKNKR